MCKKIFRSIFWVILNSFDTLFLTVFGFLVGYYSTYASKVFKVGVLGYISPLLLGLSGIVIVISWKSFKNHDLADHAKFGNFIGIDKFFKKQVWKLNSLLFIVGIALCLWSIFEIISKVDKYKTNFRIIQDQNKLEIEFSRGSKLQGIPKLDLILTNDTVITYYNISRIINEKYTWTIDKVHPSLIQEIWVTYIENGDKEQFNYPFPDKGKELQTIYDNYDQLKIRRTDSLINITINFNGGFMQRHYSLFSRDKMSNKMSLYKPVKSSNITPERHSIKWMIKSNEFDFNTIELMLLFTLADKKYCTFLKCDSSYTMPLY